MVKRSITMRSSARCPVDRLLSISDRPDLGKISAQLKHSSTHVVGVGMQGQPPPSLATKCWIYFPEPEFPFYRVTVFSNYSSNNVPKPGQQWSLMAEVSESPQKAGDYAVVEQVVAGLRLAKLIPLGADVCSTWHRRLEYGYPTPSRNREAIIEELQPNLEAMGMYEPRTVRGMEIRGQQPSHCLMQGIEAVDQILLGARTTLRFPAIVNAGKIAGRTCGKPIRRQSSMNRAMARAATRSIHALRIAGADFHGIIDRHACLGHTWPFLHDGGGLNGANSSATAVGFSSLVDGSMGEPILRRFWLLRCLQASILAARGGGLLPGGAISAAAGDASPAGWKWWRPIAWIDLKPDAEGPTGRRPSISAASRVC